jgi:hypothetical protein
MFLNPSSHIHLVYCVDSTVADIHLNRSNVRTPLCDVLEASRMEIMYRSHHICWDKREREGKMKNNFYCEYPTNIKRDDKELNGFNSNHPTAPASTQLFYSWIHGTPVCVCACRFLLSPPSFHTYRATALPIYLEVSFQRSTQSNIYAIILKSIPKIWIM